MPTQKLPKTFDEYRGHQTLKAQIDELMATEAYQKQGHPDHIATVKKVNSLYGYMVPNEPDED
jgi:Holliday junction resolvasome RuvABC ATP-dependent DNA helicase subunit